MVHVRNDGYRQEKNPVEFSRDLRVLFKAGEL